MTFHFWRTDLLADDLATNRLTEGSAVKYMLLGSALYTQSIYFALWFGAHRDWMFFFEVGLVLVISLIGINECFRANGGNEGSQFITRLSTLAVPIGLKLAIAGLVISQGFYYAAPYVLSGGAFRDPQMIYRYVSFLMPVAFTFVYYWRIAYHLNVVRTKSEAGARSAL